jgi:signal transduction histidine kinase
VSRTRDRLVVDDDGQEGMIGLEAAVVVLNPSFSNLFMKNVTHERVGPIISASLNSAQALSPSDVGLELFNSSRACLSTAGIGLTVMPIDVGLAIEADRQVLAAVVGNLLQNAFKFTKPGTTVTLTVGESAERVLIEIHDECGGLPGNINELFCPFEQHSADRTGLGLGLAFSRWGVEENNGRISARNLPDRGCVLTLDLPRVPIPAVAMV